MKKKNLSQLEIAQIFGEPKDPRRPYPDLIAEVAETDTANPEDYYYYFDALLDTDKIYVITATGELTQENVSPDTPALLAFSDLSSPEYFIKITDLAKAKETVIKRKLRTINRAMNAYENYKITSLCSTACAASGNQISLGSGETRFNFSHLVTMKHTIKDYGDDFVLLVGSDVDLDIDLWDWNDNKYHSLKDALEQLRIRIVRVTGSVDIDGSTTNVLASTKAYLVARSTEMGRPIVFVRKRLDDIEILGGVIKEADGDKPERLVFASPNPVTHVSADKRYLAVGITGFEEIAAAVVNQYGIVEFTRA